MVLILPLLWWLLSLSEVTQGVILDPALFLAPSPPLTPSRYALTAVEMWTETLADRMGRVSDDVSVLPLRKSKPTTTTEEPLHQTTEGLTGENIVSAALSESHLPSIESTRNPEDSTGEAIVSTPLTASQFPPIEPTRNPDTNDPRSSYYGLGGIHLPLSFSISGSYGRYGARIPSVVASSYAMADTSDSLMGIFSFGNNAKPALAGSSYNYNSMGSVNPLLRIYGSGGSGPSWSGWGNGKWGHYGKG